MRYAFVARERTCYPLRLLCRVLNVSVSGFHDHDHVHRQRAPRPDPDAAVRADLRTIHEASHQAYGRHRMVEALRACAHSIGPKRVAKLMREEGVCGRIKGRFEPRTTNSKHGQLLAANRLDRRLAVDAAAPAWVGDIASPLGKAGCTRRS